MSTCPHCGKRANPLRFLRYAKWAPYRCPACHKASRFNEGGLILTRLVALIPVLVLLTFFRKGPWGWWLALVVFGSLLMALGMSFLRLYPVDDDFVR